MGVVRVRISMNFGVRCLSITGVCLLTCIASAGQEKLLPQKRIEKLKAEIEKLEARIKELRGELVRARREANDLIVRRAWDGDIDALKRILDNLSSSGFMRYRWTIPFRAGNLPQRRSQNS